MYDGSQDNSKRGDESLSTQDSEDDTQDKQAADASKGVPIYEGKRKRASRLQNDLQNDEMECNENSEDGGSTQHCFVGDWDDEPGTGKKAKKYGRRILINQHLEPGMVLVHCIDCAVVDNDASKHRRVKIYRAKLERKEVSRVDYSGRFFNWYSLYTRYMGRNDDDSRLHPKGEPKALPEGSSNGSANPLGNFCDALERKMGSNLGQGINCNSRGTI